MITFTVATITNVNIQGHIHAILKTASALPHKCKKLFISPTKPRLPADFKWQSIPEFKDWKFPNSLNVFLIRRFADFIDTDYVIYVQDDGYARNRDRWSDAFLEYDFIGAPWPVEWNISHYVGNGGFSLRSRQLLSLCQFGPEPSGSEPEDVHICRTHRDWFEQHRCIFAPPEVAIHFSMESASRQWKGWNPRNSFGFHGKHFLQTLRR